MKEMILCKIHYKEFAPTKYARKLNVVEGTLQECEFCIEIRNRAIMTNTSQGEEYDIGTDGCEAGVCPVR